MLNPELGRCQMTRVNWSCEKKASSSSNIASTLKHWKLSFSRAKIVERGHYANSQKTKLGHALWQWSQIVRKQKQTQLGKWRQCPGLDSRVSMPFWLVSEECHSKRRMSGPGGPTQQNFVSWGLRCLESVTFNNLLQLRLFSMYEI